MTVFLTIIYVFIYTENPSLDREIRPYFIDHSDDTTKYRVQPRSIISFYDKSLTNVSKGDYQDGRQFPIPLHWCSGWWHLSCMYIQEFWNFGSQHWLGVFGTSEILSKVVDSYNCLD
jgi:hypothetical protein